VERLRAAWLALGGPGEPPGTGPELAAALIAAVTDQDETTLDRGVLRAAVTELAQRLAERVPGHAVEVRIPPYVAVQAIPGPAHTRGTPPNVVETDPVSWLRLATGRLAWAEAVRTGKVRASGERADISPYLPLL
jgi:Bacterial SCP ortholog